MKILYLNLFPKKWPSIDIYVYGLINFMKRIVGGDFISAIDMVFYSHGASKDQDWKPISKC